ncbi:MAG: DUF4105 domain-containing protein [Hyphomicrobiales bacterium]
MRRFAWVLARILLGLVIAAAAAWGFFALWYRGPAPEGFKFALCAAFALIGLVAVLQQFGKRRNFWVLAFAMTFGSLLIWWTSLEPPKDGNWSPDVARQTTGTIEGDTLKLANVRGFEWHSKTDFTEKWANETYDLGKLQTLDIFLSYWGVPHMAHFILSFGFADGEYLAWSVEVKRERDGEFSPVADLFKANPLIILATKEQDVVGVRSNIRDEDVHIFRMRAPPERARKLLEEYVREANDLAERPRWYNSFSTNCTTVIFKMLRLAGEGVPFDWRVVVNGYLPEMMHDRGSVNTSVSSAQLRELGRIAPRALAVGLGPRFSEAIRQGVPLPD